MRSSTPAISTSESSHAGATPRAETIRPNSPAATASAARAPNIIPITRSTGEGVVAVVHGDQLAVLRVSALGHDDDRVARSLRIARDARRVAHPLAEVLV